MKLQYIKNAFLAEWLKKKGLGLVITGILCGAIMAVLSFVISIFVKDSRIYDGITKPAVNYGIESSLSGFGSFFLLIFILICSARIAQTDHRNNGWTFMETQPLSKFSIYFGKFLVLCALSLICIFTFFISTALFFSLKQAVFPQENLVQGVYFAEILHQFIRLFILSLGIISLQLMLSMIIRGFVWPFMIGFLGFVVNVAAKIRQETYDYIPYNYLNNSLDLKNSSQMNHFLNYSDWLALFWAVLFFIIGFLIYKNRGIKNAFFKNGKIIGKTILGLLIFCGFYFFITKPIYPQKNPSKTIVEGEISAKKQPKFVTLYSQNIHEEIAKIPVKDGKFLWESADNLPFDNYILDMENRYVPMVLSKGDHIILKIDADETHFEVAQNGTRKAEAQFLKENSQDFSKFYDYIVKNKIYTNQPEKFYEIAQEQWNDDKKYIDNFRTNENIHFGEDFYRYIKQKSAVRMLSAISSYQKMTSETDAKFAPPKDFLNDLKSTIQKPENLLLTTNDYTDYKLNTMLSDKESKNPDSLVLVKISAMPKSAEKDQLLKSQLLKSFDLMKDENQRNQLLQLYSAQFSNSKFLDFTKNQLAVINNQQKGKPFPPITLEDSAGNVVNLSQFKGKFVALDLWATWCGPCKETAPQFEYQARNYKNSDIVFISASIDEDKNKWKLDIKNKNTTAKQLWIRGQKALQLLGVQSIPRFMMLDKEGKIYNADLPRPNETNFTDILDGVSKVKNFEF